MREIENLILKANYFSKENISDEKLFNRLEKLRETVLRRDENSCKLLNKGNVTGIWYLTHLNYDGNPQIIVRTSITPADERRIFLNGEIFDIVFQDVIYDYDRDIIKGNQMIEGEQAELLEEIREGRILAVYDKGRDE